MNKDYLPPHWIKIQTVRLRIVITSFLILLLCYISFVTQNFLSLELFKDLREVVFFAENENEKVNYRNKEFLACPSPINSLAAVQSVPHVGTVNIPVGSATTSLKKWSNSSTWLSNLKPTANDDVLIPSNSVVVLDENVSLKSLTIEGKLIIDLSKNITINAEYIIVKGASSYFEWGTPSQPYNNKGIITLMGSDATKLIPGTTIESKGILVMNNAKLEMHGKVKTSWTNLSSNVAAGNNTITIATATNNWEVGDEIVITSSRLSENEAEKRSITAISPDKRTFTLNAALGFPHIGQSKTYTRSNDGKTWTGDMRAEVGLLSKSIKIQGDASSDSNGFGGHVMVHMEGISHINNVEFFRMGQKKKRGRYPFHWHLLQEKGAGQYLKNSSVHKSFNRAITIHGTESTLVENNFCYDHLGHGIFLEDGSERFNTIKGNVVLLSKRPAANEELTPSENEANEVQNRTPASFWITNPNNIFENNVAAGTHGTGFWFAMPKKPMAESATIPRFQNMEPHKEPLGKFSGNKAHSSKNGFDIFDQLTPAHALIRNGGWERTDLRVMDNCTWYACDLAIYGGIGGGRRFTEGVVFRNNIFLDNVTALMHANYSLVEQSVFVANSGENVFVGERKLARGYDGAFSIKNSHLVGWQASNANYVQNTGGAMKHVNYRVSGITKDHAGPPRMAFPDYSVIPAGDVGANDIENPRLWSYVHWDIDGSLGGKANTSIITNHPLCRDGSEVRYENWTNLYRTDRRFAYMLLDYEGDPRLTIVRTKTGTPKAGQYYINGFYGSFVHFPVIVNDGFLYTIQFEKFGSTKSFGLRMMDDYVPGDKVTYKFKELGRLAGIKVDNAINVSSLSNLESSTATCYTIIGNDLYVKMVSVSSTPDISVNVNWTGSITLPVLDTDGDGTTDLQESINGTDPIPNGAIPTNPVLPISSNVLVTSVSISPSSLNLNIGQTSQLIPTVLPANATNKSVTYTSSNTSVATINSTGLVAAIAAGSATITVRTNDGNKTAVATVAVTAATVPVTSVSVSSSSLSLNVGQTSQLTPMVLPANATNKVVTYTSSNTSVATISNTGLVTAVANGTATITVKTQDGDKTASAQITVSTVAATQSAYPNGTPFAIPGIVEAENFDNGGQGVAYNDTDSGNTGNEYRTTEGVDIQTFGEGGFNVGWAQDGEWLEYTVNVARAGNYKMDIHYAALSNTGNIHVEFNGANVTQAISLLPTGAWQTYKTVSKTVTLNAGTQVMRVAIDAGGINLNKITVTEIAPVNQTYTLSPIDDAYLDGSTRYNTAELRVENGMRKTYLLFDLSQVSGSITEASLKLAVGTDPGAGTIVVSQGNGTNWTENNLLTSNAPSTSTTLGSLTTTYSVGQTYTWSLSPSTLSGGGKLSLIITHTSGNDTSFGSDESATAALKPVLTIKTNASSAARTTQKSLFDMYPNPADGKDITLQFKENKEGVHIIVVDMTGRVVFEKFSSEESFVINKEKFRGEGIYYVKVYDSSYQEVKSLILK
jgi:uncharacterized protein YjdB